MQPCSWYWLSALLLLLAAPAVAQEEAEAPVERGSLVEDRAARKLLAAGDARLEVNEPAKAIEIWQSVVERYPSSRVRFDAHMRLGEHLLQRERAFDRARAHFEAVKSEENRDQEQRATATLKVGVCYYHDRDYGKCFQVMREVIEVYPASPQVNEAYYYIGLGHFQLGHYSRAIEALEKVGTTLANEEGKVEKLEAGRRLFVRIEDADLAVLDPEQAVEVRCEVSSGDVETVRCYSAGRNVRLVLGSIATKLGAPAAENGRLEVKGGDTVKILYVDQHTADKQLNQQVIGEVAVVGNAQARITDGAYAQTLQGVVLGKMMHLQISDADFDQSDKADTLRARLEVYRLKKQEDLEAEAVAVATEGEAAAEALAEPTEEEQYRLVDQLELTLVEAPPSAVDTRLSDEDGAATGEQAAVTTPPVDETVHTGIFRGSAALQKTEEVQEGDDALQALPEDRVQVVYVDEKHRNEGPRKVIAEALCLEGNIGGVRVARAVISDQELRLQTNLKTAEALTQIGNRYKEFGLKTNADAKYRQAVVVCEQIMDEAQQLGGSLLEQTYVQLWRVYFEMDQLSLAAAMCERLQQEFPTSGFLDDAMLQLADVARKQGELQRAIGIYSRLVGMKTSQLRGEAQFGIAACYEQMASESEGNAARHMADRAFQEYKKVFDRFPESGRVGEAVAKMADYYYQQKDYHRAIDTFETVLADHPDAQFIDVILFNYGRCLYRMNRKSDARQRFEQVIGDFPESELADDAKKIADALSKAGF